MVMGDAQQWNDVVESFVPDILSVTIASWESLSPIASDETEDNITLELCRALRKNRSVRELPFHVHSQLTEIDPQAGTGQGRQDIVFSFFVPDEAIYFCLEGKRLNATSGGKVRAYASEYVSDGMMRFVTGQYSKAVHHGGMIGYVLDKNVKKAIANVENNTKSSHVALRMSPPGVLQQSTVLSAETRAKETHHNRLFDAPSVFCLHHLFMPTS
jgi:hypothetical protein